MAKFVMGFVLGVVVSSIGFAGLAHWLDQGVAVIKDTTERAVAR
jgi:hypothetical protein